VVPVAIDYEIIPEADLLSSEVSVDAVCEPTYCVLR